MITLKLTRDEQLRPVCRINQEGDSPPVGPVQLLVVARAEVRDPDGIPCEQTIHSSHLALRPGTQDVLMPLGLATYNYYGHDVSVKLILRLADDRGRVLVESRIMGRTGSLVAPRPKLAESAEALMNPKDEYSVLSNLKALPPGALLSVASIGLGLYLLAGLNLLVGARDQFVAEAPLTAIHRLNLTLKGRQAEAERVPVAPYFYGKGSRRMPLLDAFEISLPIAVLGWVVVRRNLPRYGDFRLLESLPPLRPGTRVAARELIRGRPHVDLLAVTVRVVAANIECGQRKPGRGETAPKSFRTPVRAVKLYECELPYVPAGASLGELLSGEVDFGPMFRALYPPLMVTTTHGLDLAWQVQLLHPEFVDQSLPGPTSGLRFADFLES